MEYLILLIATQYVLVFPLTLFFGANRILYGFNRLQWFLYWLPLGYWVYSVYCILKFTKELLINNNYEKK